MKKLIALVSLLFLANSFAYIIGDAAGACKKMAKTDVESILEYEREQQNGSRVNYIVRGPIADVQMTSDPHEWVKVKVEILTYTLDDDGFELNELYLFSGEYDPVGRECHMSPEPQYVGNYCGDEGEPKCKK